MQQRKHPRWRVAVHEAARAGLLATCRWRARSWSVSARRTVSLGGSRTPRVSSATTGRPSERSPAKRSCARTRLLTVWRARPPVDYSQPW